MEQYELVLLSDFDWTFWNYVTNVRRTSNQNIKKTIPCMMYK